MKNFYVLKTTNTAGVKFWGYVW